ncbi:MAG: 3-phosphoshikimate 1-carboxyvinyltransferase, partial [Saprospiraceae bacterium]
ATIDFLEKDGYPPLRIGLWSGIQHRDTVALDASQSSQFATALLLIAPKLPRGLRIRFEGPLASRPYVELTVSVMRHFGADVEWETPFALRVAPGAYRPAPLQIEADWSAASYWYALAFAARESAEFNLEGLSAQSLQGDRALARMMQGAGIESRVWAGEDNEAKGIQIRRAQGASTPPLLEWDFTDNPDLAPALIAACAARGIKGLFSGLDNLSLKESDRMAALKTELAKVSVRLLKLPPHFSKKKTYFLLEGQATWDAEAPQFEAYDDHRIAMALSVLATRGPIIIRGADAVAKSYPEYWRHFERLY